MFPLQYAQAVEGSRPDVDVIIVDALLEEWYRDDVEADLPITTPLPAQVPDPAEYAAALVDELEGLDRPVLIDLSSAQVLREGFGYEPRGVVGEVVLGIDRCPAHR